MLIVKTEPEENGAHANQNCPGFSIPVPEGWAEIPQDMEEAVLSVLPWVKLTAENGIVTSAAEDTEARATYELALEQEAQNELNK
jgi:hypothetical protein